MTTNVDKNPRLRLHADISKLARERGVINELGLELRKHYLEGNNPSLEEELDIKLKTLETLVGGNEVEALRSRAASLYRLPTRQ